VADLARAEFGRVVRPVHPLRAEGHRPLDLIAARGGPFAEDWPAWRADEGRPRPALP
jgi:hypothetical protein